MVKVLRPPILSLCLIAGFSFIMPLTAYGGNTDSTRCSGGIVAPTIAGQYVDNYGGHHNITANQWSIGNNPSSDLIFDYCSLDNPEEVIIAQNGPNNEYNPNRFSQFNWVSYEGNLWYCQEVFDALTEEDAASHPPADPSNPPAGGCGQNNFPWSQLIPD
ncbi:hypothetical protein [Moorena sp. SIO3H5]|uniref:hypothetical protein n=1 Tax=Moorena sp. SIO3H5 TaxID=2607834 RepID=UPI0013BCD6F5|nr:hypothetical protein [Moorena sp. SIO3H5]NEO73250.1 hypothetical protein [Moorena sp. SIO3H5]